VLLRDALGETLRNARTQQNRTLRDVSTAANVSLGYLSEVERGRKEASSELLASICDALDLELSDLLDTVSRTMRSDVPVAAGTAPNKGSVITNSTKPGLGDSNRPRSGGLDLDPTLRIVLPYGSTRPGAPVG
jgi:transcriptional regulator with XRE-family HTH domain